MSYKFKKIALNVLTVFLGLAILWQVAFLFLKKIFKEDQAIDVKVEAVGNVDVIKKTGLLNLVGKNVNFDLSNQIVINSKESFINAFNGYFEKLKQEGGYALKSDGLISGTATIFGSSITCYQATQGVYEVDCNGNVFSEVVSAEVPSPSGNTTGYGLFSGKRMWISENAQKQQETSSVSYFKENNSYVLSANYEGREEVQIQKDRECTLLPFEVNAQSISDIKIEENALSYRVILNLNIDGYKQIATDTMIQGDAIKMPDFKEFKIDIMMNKLGDVISFTISENYIITVKRVGMNIDSNTQSNSSYIIKKKEIE